MDVTVQYFDGCPNWTSARDAVRKALDTLGLADQAIALSRVETEADAERLGFHGSPTVLIDGADPFADPSVAAGLTCRLYDNGDGISSAPSHERLLRALTVASKQAYGQRRPTSGGGTAKPI